MNESATILQRESLTCPRCSHAVTTAKTLGKPDALAITCPQCSATSTLAAWRGREEIAFVEAPAPAPRDPSRRRFVSWFEKLVAGLLFWLGMIGMLGVIPIAILQVVNGAEGDVGIWWDWFVWSLVLSALGIIVDRVLLLPSAEDQS